MRFSTVEQCLPIVISILEINEGIDNGPIISQVSFPVYPKFDEVIHVFKRSLDYGFCLIKHALVNLDLIVPKEQNEEKASIYYRKDSHLLGHRSTFTKELSKRITK
jgi:methionyl-tRNA formyltransferase